MNSDRQKTSVGKEMPPQRCDTDKETAAWMPGPCQGHLQRETGTKVKQPTGDQVRRPIAQHSSRELWVLSRRATLAGLVSAVTLLLEACPCSPFL